MNVHSPTGYAQTIDAPPCGSARPAALPGSPVSSHNEWDPLEEIVVGRLDGSVIPSAHPVVTCNIPGAAALGQRLTAGMRYPRMMLGPAQRELEGLVALLESLGVTVRRPDPWDHRARFRTPHFSSRGFCNTCPRDNLLVVGDDIIETPMAWPCRYFENFSYRAILKDYFRRGARWTAAPRPQLSDDLFDPDFTLPHDGEAMAYILTEFEPVFDAADFFRCGYDIFCIRSNVTNAMGIEWLRRHLGPDYRVHEIESRCRNPMHIDTTVLPLGPGKLLVNPDYCDPDRLPDILKTWDILIAPEPTPIEDRWLRLTSLCGKWLSMNILAIDEKRIICDPHHLGMIRALERWGFEPIPCPFLHYAAFGGAFHCATLDVRRRGTLERYF